MEINLELLQKVLKEKFKNTNFYIEKLEWFETERLIIQHIYFCEFGQIIFKNINF